MSEIVVRTAEPTDAAGMARVHVQSWQETYRGIESDEVLDAPDFVERRTTFWTRSLESPRRAETHAAAAVAVDTANDEIVGIASAADSRDEDAPRPRQLFIIYTLARVHGSGAGQMLLDAVLGESPASVWVEEKNPRARAFYRRNGFVEDGTVHVEGGFTEIRMVLG